MNLVELLLSIPAVLLALTVHEYAHGYAAYKLGDPTARALGRLSLNPLRHLDPIGTVCMVLFRFGWARPVPINARYFRKPRRDMAITALAGPLANVILSFLGLGLYLLARLAVNALYPWLAVSTLLLRFAEFTCLFLLLLHYLNLSLAIFNLIPIPPLDGSRILGILLPPKYYFGFMKYERYIALALMILLWLGVLTPVLSFAVDGISRGMLWLFGLIPGLV